MINWKALANQFPASTPITNDTDNPTTIIGVYKQVIENGNMEKTRYEKIPHFHIENPIASYSTEGLEYPTEKGNVITSQINSKPVELNFNFTCAPEAILVDNLLDGTTNENTKKKEFNYIEMMSTLNAIGMNKDISTASTLYQVITRGKVYDNLYCSSLTINENIENPNILTGSITFKEIHIAKYKIGDILINRKNITEYKGQGIQTYVPLSKKIKNMIDKNKKKESAFKNNYHDGIK